MRRPSVLLAAVIFTTCAVPAGAQPAPVEHGAADTIGADTPPPPLPAPPRPPADGMMPPPNHRPPPPPPSASIEMEHGASGNLKLVIHCAEHESTQSCSTVASELLVKLQTPAGPK